MVTSNGTTAGTDRGAVALGDDFGFALGTVFRSYAKTASIVLDEVPGGPRGYQVVSAAARGEVESQTGLAQQLGIDRTVMTYLLDDLEQAGLVTRRPSPTDRRHRHIVATDKGKRLCETTEQRLRLVEDCVLEGLSAEERKVLRDLLERLASRAVGADPMGDACRVLGDLAEVPVDSPRRRARTRH